MDLSTVLGSGVVAGLVAGLVTLRTTERKITIENITQQRQLWREKIREIALRITDSYQKNDKNALHSQYVELQLILNPQDVDDISILDTIWEMINKENSSNKDIELTEKLSLLLKHDWERAKLEAKPVWYFWGKPKRIRYAQFEYRRNERMS